MVNLFLFLFLFLGELIQFDRSLHIQVIPRDPELKLHWRMNAIWATV